MSDPYKVLGITREATDDEVKKAYRSMSKKYHPDANINNPNKEKAEEMFKLVQEAYQQIIYERQHPYASQGASGSGSYGTGGSYGSGNAYYSGQNMNGQFYTSWEDFFNDFRCIYRTVSARQSHCCGDRRRQVLPRRRQLYQ